MSKDSSSSGDVTRKLNYSPASAIFVTFGIYLAAQILAYSLLLGFNVIAGRDPSGLFESSSSKLVFSALIAYITYVLIRGYLKRAGNSLADIGLKVPKLSDPLFAIGGFFVYFLSFVITAPLLKLFIPSLDLEQSQDLGFVLKDGLAVLIISLVIIPPIIEEILIRGFLFGGLRTRLNFWTSTILTSIVFGLAHLPGGEGGPLWVGLVDTFLLSVVLCYLREKTNGLAAPILLHMIKNALALTYLVHIG
jgi:membrane protease YdiL (CAAX protease family)